MRPWGGPQVFIPEPIDGGPVRTSFNLDQQLSGNSIKVRTRNVVIAWIVATNASKFAMKSPCVIDAIRPLMLGEIRRRVVGQLHDRQFHVLVRAPVSRRRLAECPNKRKQCRENAAENYGEDHPQSRPGCGGFRKLHENPPCKMPRRFPPPNHRWNRIVVLIITGPIRASTKILNTAGVAATICGAGPKGATPPRGPRAA